MDTMISADEMQVLFDALPDVVFSLVCVLAG